MSRRNFRGYPAKTTCYALPARTHVADSQNQTGRCADSPLDRSFAAQGRCCSTKRFSHATRAEAA
jgi:hypothetical protein